MNSLKRWLAYLALVVVLAFGMLFAVQNTQKAPLDLLLIQLPEQRVALWVLLAFAIGGVAGLMISSAAMIRLKSRTLLLQRKIDRQTKELDSLRTADLRTGIPKS